MSIISVIYHIEKIIIPLEKRTDFEMTLEIIIIIISKRKSYLILAEGQHDGTSPAYTWSMLQASLLQERNTIYRYNGSVHRWIVVRQGFSLPIKSHNFGAWLKYWKYIQANIFSAVSFTVATMNQPVIVQVCCHRFSLITQTQICYSTCNISAAMQVGPFQVHFIISRHTFV